MLGITVALPARYVSNFDTAGHLGLIYAATAILAAGAALTLRGLRDAGARPACSCPRLVLLHSTRRAQRCPQRALHPPTAVPACDTADMEPPMLDLVTVDPAVCHGKPCIRGTRVLVSVVLSCLAAGMTEGEILSEYPTLTVDGVRAAAAYGAWLADAEFQSLVPAQR